MSVKSQSGSIASSIKKGVPSKVSDDGLDDEVDEKGVTKRKSRNLSEKKRRDQFNLLIHELCSVVCSGKRKMDKSTILKSAISFIRNHNQATSQNNCPSRCSGTDDWKPSFLSNEEFTHLMLEALDEFVIVLSGRNGRIVYVSENITSLLGHLPNELIGSLVTDLIWEEERQIVEEFLGSRRSSEQEPSRNEHINFSCHLRRGNAIDGASGNVYEMVYFSGYYRIQGNPEIPSMSRVSSAWGDDSKESASYGESLSQYNGLVFVASARLQTPQLLVEMSIIDVSKSEFTSRHSLEWKFLFLDHRGPPIIGYLPFEVLGTSGYDYYHVDDLEKVSACHEALMQKGEVTSCCYRFLTKGQQWIWLQTKYYITYHQWYSKPEFIVCTHRVISYNDVTGHPLKLEAEEGDISSDAPCPSTPVPLNKFRAEMKSFFASSRDNKPSEKLRMQAGSFSGGLSVKKNSILAQPSKSSIKKHTSNHLPRHKRSSSTNEANQVLSPSRESFQSCATTMMSHDSSQQSKQAPHSHMGVALSDTGSFSSSTSFQSAASQHSRHSDASMHSIHSQQSHHSMQSVHSQHTQHSQQSMQRPPSQACSAHSCVSMTHNHSQPPISQYQQQQQQQQHQSANYARPQATHVSGGEMEIRQMEQNNESYDLGEHRFLQPRINSVGQVATTSRNFGMISMPNHATVVNTVASSSHPVTCTAASVGAFGYQTMDNNSMAQTGVTLPVQRVIEGLPVVSLPGIVAHERMLTPAQREQQELLRMKHLEIQKSIMAQQEELRRISEQLLLSTWGPSVLKMSVPEGDGNVASSSQTTHVGLIGNSSAGQMTFSPGTSILVHSPELYHALSPDRTGESLCLSTDPSQMVLRTALQQETLVQISQQDIQMLLAQSLLQENPPSSSDYQN